MNPEEYEFLYQLEERFWWFVAMRRITDAIVDPTLKRGPQRILDAGCGTGFNLAHFTSIGRHEVFGLDISANAIESVRNRGFTKVCQASITEIPYASSSIDMVLSFDVLCQVDRAAGESSLKEIARILRPGGSFFVRVPAFEWMRSSHDDAVHSKRRFSKAQLTTEIVSAGLYVERISYANFFLFPVVILRRILKSLGVGRGSDVRPLPGALGWIDPVFRNILQFEASLLRGGLRLPFGLSLICLARKPGSTKKPLNGIHDPLDVTIQHSRVDR
jgi:SAM-dependent methyltransferase